MGLVRSDVSEERTASIIRVTRIGELGATLTLASNRRKPRKNTITSITVLYYYIILYHFFAAYVSC
jgi:hypothetical protein